MTNQNLMLISMLKPKLLFFFFNYNDLIIITYLNLGTVVMCFYPILIIFEIFLILGYI